MNSCNICNQETNTLFTGVLLHKHTVRYYQCTSCKFIQTEQPYWLEEAYSEPIPDVDVGYVTRNNFYAERTSTIVKKYFNPKGRYVDFGGGYGMFTRLMRDKGFNFYRQDSYCENFFASHFDVTDLQEQSNFELLTAFEVFEHLVNPMQEIEAMLRYSDSILFSTNLQPNQSLKSTDDWWYFSVEKGQHISLYHQHTLEYIAKFFKCNLYTNNETFHLLTRKNLSGNPIKYAQRKNGIFDRIFNRNFSNQSSLIQKDFEYVKALNEKNNTNS